jgi:serine/threonine protein kinase
MTAGVGSFRWIAPELFLSGQYDEKVDVYSFAVIMWEMMHPGTIPLAHYTPVEAAIAAAHRNVRPQVTIPISRKLARLLRACWHGTPTERPPFARIVELIEAARDKLAAGPKGFSLLGMFR